MEKTNSLLNLLVAGNWGHGEAESSFQQYSTKLSEQDTVEHEGVATSGEKYLAISRRYY